MKKNRNSFNKSGDSSRNQNLLLPVFSNKTKKGLLGPANRKAKTLEARVSL
jgi:hypothetical protein